MFVQDKIADMLTRIRNANQMKYATVEVIGTKMTLGIAELLKNEGFIEDYKIVKDSVQGTLVLTLKYVNKKERVITGLKRISKQDLEFMLKLMKYQEYLMDLV